MANERKTEEIVRSHFKKDPQSNLLKIEEQKSDTPSIDKLLKNASKDRDGIGKPDFIISHKKYQDLVIVVECKENLSKHESKNRDKYKDFAVDGVLLYSSYLVRGFNVLSIAVSGETKKKLKVSHFLHLKDDDNNDEIPIFSNKLLSVDSYLSGYLESPQKLRQDYHKLLDFTEELNKKLHRYKIIERDRSLLISSILIALENKAFKKSYSDYGSSKNLACSLVRTVSDELEDADITGQKLNNLNNKFSFIKTDFSLSKKPGILEEIIDEIDENINSFIKTHKYIDVLGQLYIEFLRYANSDKGLGIVLTPPHITEFFADLAQVNKKSIIYDNCAGTGGFLISAMKKMIADAKGNKSVIKNIKLKQLIGVEYQAYIFPLAVSNMYIHQDGKTNIINGDCFDRKIIQLITSQKPTIGLLNPPYKSDKKTDIEELEFVLNNLECLSYGGTCIAIVPMQSALAIGGRILELKKKLLQNHTLEAVLSMPDELFFNSKANVVSCVMIFTAHRAHPSNKKTYFGYYKEDGFVKRKKRGRTDANGRWDKIKDKWVLNFINRINQPGISVNKIINSDMEWCAEAYMGTNYSILSDDDFVKTQLNYVTFLFSSELVDQVSKLPFSKRKLPLNISSWRKIRISDLFYITGSRTTAKLQLEKYKEGPYPYVTTQATNNGVAGFYNFSSEEGGILTAESAVLGYCSYQPFRFSASDHVEKLIPKFKMNKYVAMFLVTVLNLEQYRYNYGRKCNQIRMEQISIKLPKKNEQPDFKYMERYIKSLPYSSSL